MADELPHLVFRMTSDSASQTSQHTLLIRLSLDAEVRDPELWKSVRKQFAAGLKVYASNDFKTELNEVLKDENKELDRKSTELEKAYKALMEKHKALTEEAAKMREALSVLNSQLWDQELGLGEPDTER